MIMVDVASNFVFLKALKGKTSKELAAALRNMMAHYGVPMRVRHDQERGLMGGEFKDLCNELSIIQETGLPNKPQTNGKVEAQVKNLKYALKCLTSSEGSPWPQLLWKVQLALNASVSRATMETPEFLMFGHSSENTCYDLVSRREVTFVGIDERLHFIRTEYHEHQKRLLEVRNHHRRSNGYAEGDIVWRQVMQPTVPGVRHALEPRYRGPYVISNLTGSSAGIKGLTPSFPETVRVHVDQLKPAVAATSPSLAPSDPGVSGDSSGESQDDNNSVAEMNGERTKVGMDASFEDQMAEIQQEMAPMEEVTNSSVEESSVEIVLMPEAVEARKRWISDADEGTKDPRMEEEEKQGNLDESQDGANVFLPIDSSEGETEDDDVPNPYEGMGVWTHPISPPGPQLVKGDQDEVKGGLGDSAGAEHAKERPHGSSRGEKRGGQDPTVSDTDEYGLWVIPSPLRQRSQGFRRVGK